MQENTQTNIPSHISIIMDGNRRWAKAHGKSTIEGHQAGYAALKKVAEHALDLGVKEMSVYAFSTENWQRSAEEVRGLMDLVRWILGEEVEDLHQKNIKIRIVGLRDRLDPDLIELIDKAMERTKDNSRGTLYLCFNYGGRADIIQAAKQLIENGITASEITEESFSAALSTKGMSDVDLVIRTSECRLSNYLPWETVYSEIYFLPEMLWPDFDEAALDKAIEFYQDRNRRFGK